jgi:GNAT superfamily N-acetyltransferase
VAGGIVTAPAVDRTPAARLTCAVVDPEFVRRRTAVLSLPDGGRVRIRPIVPEDKEHIRRGFERMSEESRYRRFMGLKRLTEADLRYLTEIDYDHHFALAAFAVDDPGEPGVGVARYVRDRDDPTSAEAAVAVIDAYQGRGIGTLLLEALGAVALENGVRRFVGHVLADNRPALELLRSLGAHAERAEQGVLRLVVDLPETMAGLKDAPLYAVLRAVARGETPPFRPPGPGPAGPV